MLQRFVLIQLKQQCASPPIWCAKNSFGHSTARTRLRLPGVIQFQSMLADIGRKGETETCILGAKLIERWSRMKGGGMGLAAGLFAAVTGVIVAAWAWLGMPVEMPQAPVGPGEKLHCISYAPFRGEQNPFGPDVPIDVRQIEEDLAQLKQVTNCIRTYSIDHGLDQIPEVAGRHGLKVMQGLWLSSLPDLSRKQI